MDAAGSDDVALIVEDLFDGVFDAQLETLGKALVSVAGIRYLWSRFAPSSSSSSSSADDAYVAEDPTTSSPTLPSSNRVSSEEYSLRAHMDESFDRSLVALHSLQLLLTKQIAECPRMASVRQEQERLRLPTTTKEEKCAILMNAFRSDLVLFVVLTRLMPLFFCCSSVRHSLLILRHRMNRQRQEQEEKELAKREASSSGAVVMPGFWSTWRQSGSFSQAATVLLMKMTLPSTPSSKWGLYHNTSPFATDNPIPPQTLEILLQEQQQDEKDRHSTTGGPSLTSGRVSKASFSSSMDASGDRSSSRSRSPPATPTAPSSNGGGGASSSFLLHSSPEMAQLSYSAQRLVTVFHDVIPLMVEDAFLVVDATLFDMRDVFGGPLDAKIAPDAVLLLFETLFSLSLARMPPWTFLQKLIPATTGSSSGTLSVPPPAPPSSAVAPPVRTASVRSVRSPSPTNPDPLGTASTVVSSSLTSLSLQHSAERRGGSIEEVDTVTVVFPTASPSASQFLYPQRTEEQTKASWDDQGFVLSALFDVTTSVEFEQVAASVTKHYGRKVVEELSGKLSPHVKDGAIPLLRATLVVRSIGKNLSDQWDGWMTATVPPSRTLSSEDLETASPLTSPLLCSTVAGSNNNAESSRTAPPVVEEIAGCVTSLRKFCQLLVRAGQ